LPNPAVGAFGVGDRLRRLDRDQVGQGVVEEFGPHEARALAVDFARQRLHDLVQQVEHEVGALALRVGDADHVADVEVLGLVLVTAALGDPSAR
jgi:hypothetical protein